MVCRGEDPSTTISVEMLLTRLAQSSLRTRTRPVPWRLSYSTASKKSDPLRILFCGSDRFSCTSLQALRDEQRRNGDLIQSIDVVVRPSKPSGRGLKVLKEGTRSNDNQTKSGHIFLLRDSSPPGTSRGAPAFHSRQGHFHRLGCKSTSDAPTYTFETLMPL